MTGWIAAVLVLGQTEAPTLAFRDGAFQVTDAQGSQTVGLKAPLPQKLTTFRYAVKDVEITWKDKKLVYKKGAKATAARLADVLTSPKYFEKDEILQTQFLIQTGKRFASPDGLSGVERIGQVLYFVTHWVQQEQGVWLHALIKIDLAARAPAFQVVGVSTAGPYQVQQVDNLFTTAGGMTLAAQATDHWATITWDLKSGESSQATGGRGQASLFPLEGQRSLQFVERTSYGSLIAGSFDVGSEMRTNLTESRHPINFIGPRTDVVRIEEPGRVVLRNTDSGLELVLPKDVGTRAARAGVVVWTPADKPQTAVLYSVNTLRAITRWNAKPVRAAAL